MESDTTRTRAEHYRAMAERVLADAQRTQDPTARSTLLEIASQCAWLADWSERSKGGAR